MSLQVWLPLNGDLKNYGLTNVSTTNNGCLINNNGKIGKCYQFINNATIKLNDFSLLPLDNFTIAFWAKGTTDNVYGCVFSQRTEIGTAQRTIFFYGTKHFYFDEGNRWEVTVSNNYSATKWTHYAFVKEGTSRRIYINGELAASNDTANTPNNLPTIAFIGSSQNSSSTVSSNYFTGYINDYRVYNHCLSAKEIKEISKGMILHYKLDDRYMESTVNLVTGLTKGGRTSVSNGIVTTSGENADTYFTINLSESVVEGTTYSISCEASGLPEGVAWCFPMGWQGNTSYCFYIYNGHNEYTFTANSGSWGTNRLFMDDNNSSAVRASGNITQMWNFQVEKKDHATPYILNSRNGTIVYDCSGYGNNGIASGNLQVLSLSPRYNRCTYWPIATSAVNTIHTPVIYQSGEAITMSIWIKSTTTGGNSYQMPFESNTRAYCEMSITSGGSLRGGLYINGTRYVQNVGSGLLDGNWHMIAITYNGSVIKRYIDGISKGDTNIAGTLNNTEQSYWFGVLGTDTGYYSSDIYCSDARIYATALSAEDIKELYDTSMVVDNNGNIHARELVEL